MNLKPRIKRLFENMSYPEKIVGLAGDASTRSYFRAHFSSGDTAVVMLQAHPGENEEEAFIEIQNYLETLGFPVPKILGHDPEQSALLLQDLGDDLLESFAETSSETELIDYYCQAVDLLAAMRSITAQSKPRCRAFDLSFDEEKLMQEMDFFITHFVEGFCCNAPSRSAAALLQEFFLKLCRFLAAEPRVFAHRDFHSRNLVLYENKVVMIDFQDARMGPAQYDLASLLRDSYVTLPEKTVTLLLDYYMDKTHEIERDRFRHVFDVMALQRNIKALGTFGYQSSVRGSGRYLSSIPRTAGYIAGNCSLHEEFSIYGSVVREYITGPAIALTTGSNSSS